MEGIDIIQIFSGCSTVLIPISIGVVVYLSAYNTACICYPPGVAVFHCAGQVGLFLARPIPNNFSHFFHLSQAIKAFLTNLCKSMGDYFFYLFAEKFSCIGGVSEHVCIPMPSPHALYCTCFFFFESSLYTAKSGDKLRSSDVSTYTSATVGTNKRSLFVRN
jgi:hypothetical protein